MAMRAFSEHEVAPDRVVLRAARPEDADAIATIYGPIVTHTAISFEEVAPSPAEMAKRIRSTIATYPWLVAEMDGEVVGYAYASPHSERAAYRWVADVSVYLATSARGLRIGRQLYERLFALLERLGYHRLYAGVKIPNPASEGLHRALGFFPVGTYHRVGFKLGRWHDVRWFELVLRDDDGTPDGPLLWPSIAGARQYRVSAVGPLVKC
jgi:phosphinothricin acetyltransferase